MPFNIKLLIAYDGTNYLGWQKTPTGNTIEGALSGALSTALRFTPLLQAASRTDAGVHAHGQVVNFIMESPPPDFGKLRHSLNALLPHDIRVYEASLAADAFHPTLDCSGKEYRYFLCFARVQKPHRRLYCWHRPNAAAAPAAIEAVAQQLVGCHDFSAFCNFRKQQKYETTVRTIDSIRCEEAEHGECCLIIRGNNFLYKMVRNIVGTLVYIAEGRLGAEELPEILAGKKRTSAGMTAPACGLTLHRVFF